jgi:hypothetical protein
VWVALGHVGGMLPRRSPRVSRRVYSAFAPRRVESRRACGVFLPRCLLRYSWGASSSCRPLRVCFAAFVCRVRRGATFSWPFRVPCNGQAAYGGHDCRLRGTTRQSLGVGARPHHFSSQRRVVPSCVAGSVLSSSCALRRPERAVPSRVAALHRSGDCVTLEHSAEAVPHRPAVAGWLHHRRERVSRDLVRRGPGESSSATSRNLARTAWEVYLVRGFAVDGAFRVVVVPWFFVVASTFASSARQGSRSSCRFVVQAGEMAGTRF